MTKKLILILIAALWLSVSPHRAFAAIQVVTTLPDFAWAARQIGGDKVEVHSLLKGNENPHYADAVPEFIRLTADADVVCLAGMDLEIGWLPKVLARSGNAKVQPGGQGYCDLSKKVDALEKVTGAVNRSMGDIHPYGNPHFWLSPLYLGKASAQILETLSTVSPANSAFFQKNYEALQRNLEGIVARNKKKLAPLLAKFKGPAMIEYHKEFVYFADTYGLKDFGSVEEKPGIPPSAGRIAEVASSAKAAGVKVALAADFDPKKLMDRFSELSGIPVIISQAAIQPDGRIKDYGALQDSLVDEIIKAWKK